MQFLNFSFISWIPWIRISDNNSSLPSAGQSPYLKNNHGLIKRSHTALMGSRSQATISVTVFLCGSGHDLASFSPLPRISLMTDLFSFSEFLKQKKRKDSEMGLDSFSVSHDMGDVHRNCIRKAVWFDIADKALSISTLPIYSVPGVLFSSSEGQCVNMGPGSPCTAPPSRFPPDFPFMNQSWFLLSCSHILVLQT